MSYDSQLAILGGSPVQNKPFQFNNAIGIEEKEAVMKVLEAGELSGFIASAGEAFHGGRKVRELQELMAEFFGVKHAVAVNSATSGLHAAVYATKVGPGDEIITSPYTMSATSTAILMCGATPIFADIEDETFGLDPASVEACITPQTKAILAVNIFGHPARLDKLKAIAEKHKLYLIEDNSQAPAARHNGRFTGTIGDMGVFSFNRHKVMQSGEGGVVLTDDDELAMRMALLRNHGEAVVDAMGIQDIVNTAGLNLRMTEMEAAVAVEQFKKLPRLNSERQELAARLDRHVRNTSFLQEPNVAEADEHVYYMYPMKFDAKVAGFTRDAFVKAMMAEGAVVRAGYLRPTFLEPVFQKKTFLGQTGFPFSSNPRNKEISYAPGLCPVCEELNDNRIVMTYIMQPPQTLADMDLFGLALQKITDNAKELANLG